MREYVTSRQVPQLPHSRHLSEFERRSMGELANRELRQQRTPIGIGSDGYPTWLWQIGTLGGMKWIISQHKLSICLAKNPLWIPLSSSSLCLEDVGVILVDEKWLDPNNMLWQLKSLQVAVCVTPWNNARKSRRYQKRP